MEKNIKNLGNAILRKKLYIILITIILAVTGVFYTLTNVKYVASQKFLIGEQENRIETYKELIRGSVVLEETIQNLGLQMSVTELAHMLKVSTVERTNMIKIECIGEDENEVRACLDELTKVFLKNVQEIYGDTEIFSVDHTADYVYEGNPVLAGFVCGFAGLILSSFFFGIGFLCDTKIRSCKDLEEITGLKSLISIPNIKMIEKKKLNIKNIRLHQSQVFKTLMTNIQFVNMTQTQSKTILITSARFFEGKSYVANNLAIEFAKAGKKVIIIDADMRRGRLAKIFNLPNDLGFSNYLSNLDVNGNVINERITRFINDTEIKNLNVITAGNTPPNPIELLNSNRLQELIKDLKVFYDVILFDTVPILEAPETMILSKVSDLTLILSSYGVTKRNEFEISYEKIKNISNTSIGVALNKIPDRKLSKKMLGFKNSLKEYFRRMNQVMKRVFANFKKLSNLGNKVLNGLKVIGDFSIVGLCKIRNVGAVCIHGIYTNLQKVREWIHNVKEKREETKLIEAGNEIFEEQQNNIIKEVFESEIAKLETEADIQYKKKLEEMKNNLEGKSVKQEEIKQPEMMVRPKVIQEKNMKSKFDLIREQQEKKEIEMVSEEVEPKEALPKIEENKEVKKIVSEENKIEVNYEKLKQEEIQRKHEQLKEKQRIERERKEHEKKLKQEETEEYQEIDFHNQENLTEEMIRKQVEMDEMVRLAEKEKEEELIKAQQMKRKERLEKRKERREKFQDMLDSIKNIKERYMSKNETKMEEKLKRESERNEYRVRMAQEKEERRAYRELERQKYKEELRMNEELQEDNLYPRPRM